MAKFAIVRHDGEVDQVDGATVEDVASRYGWPGNGTIEAWNDEKHGTPRYQFVSPEHQREMLSAYGSQHLDPSAYLAAVKAAQVRR